MSVVSTEEGSSSSTDRLREQDDRGISRQERNDAGPSLSSDDAKGRSSPRLAKLPVIQPCGCCLVAGAHSRWASSGYTSLRNISCRCDDGALVIDGTVQSYYLKQMAQELARTVDGVHRIENRLVVKTKAITSTNTRDDHTDDE